MLLFGYGSGVHAKSDGCWADFFEKAQFKGQHFKLNGPAQKKNLTKVNGENPDQYDAVFVLKEEKNQINQRFYFEMVG